MNAGVAATAVKISNTCDIHLVPAHRSSTITLHLAVTKLGFLAMPDEPIDFTVLAEAGGPVRRFKAGDVVFNRGDAARELFVIQSGKVEVRRGNRVIAAFSDHNVFGEMALIDSARRSATAVATADSTLIPVSKERFLSLVRNSPDLSINLMRLLTQRLRETERENQLLNIEAITASIAHEVKQPLTAIALHCGAGLRFLGMEPPDLDEARSLLQAIRRDSYRGVEVLDGMRNMFRRVDQARSAVDVNEIAHEVLESLQGRLKSHGIMTDQKLSSKLPPIDGNKTQLQQVILNLVNNAFEAMASHSSPNKRLRISTERRGDQAIAVKVEDTGPGISPNRLEDIFDSFFTTKAQGTGLGLAICRVIVERHGGLLTASSDGKSGAMFQFTLPIKSTDESRVQ
jgi:signal transduction histidine kinase